MILPIDDALHLRSFAADDDEALHAIVEKSEYMTQPSVDH